MSWTQVLMNWYAVHKRPFPWRNTRDPYKVWLSEIILQQTRTQQGLPYYEKFVAAFPTVRHLAAASENEVLKLWQGLGYYSRARNLWTTAKAITNELDGQFPSDFSALLRLKGVGDYTASAIASICFDLPHAVVDGNVYRVLARHFGIFDPINAAGSFSLYKEKAQQLMDVHQAGNFNQALMEFGALQCVPKNPACAICVFHTTCYAFQFNKVDFLPVKKAKAKVQKRYFNYMVLLDSNPQFILQRREAKDIWQQLYEFPLWESKRSIKHLPALAKNNVAQEINGSWRRWNQTPIKHKLSHQELHLTFWVANTKIPLRNGISPDQMEAYPVPVVIQNFITEFFELSA